MTLDLPQTPSSPSQAVCDISGLRPPQPASSHAANDSLPTPAHSVNGSMSSTSATDGMEAGEDTRCKRKRSIDDQGDRSPKKVHIEDSRLTIDDLHLDVGTKYLLCRTPHPRVSPDFTRDWFADYGLEEIALSVAREKPNGEKQSIRKTYKGHMKTLGVAGRFDADRKETDAPDTLMMMMQKPPEHWQQEMGASAQGVLEFSTSILSDLSKATAMARGSLRKEQWDASVLGEIGKSTVPTPAIVATPKFGEHASKIPLATSNLARAMKTDAIRAKRNIRKRSYADSSFEGYGETFGDEYIDDGDFSNADGDEHGPRKKTKKTSISMPPQRQYSYGPGMVGA